MSSAKDSTPRSALMRLLVAVALLLLLLLLLLAAGELPRYQEVVVPVTRTPASEATPTPTTTATPGGEASPGGEATATPTVSQQESTPEGTPVDEARAENRPYREIWLSQDELDELPTQGPAWQQLRNAAAESLSEPDIADQDDMTDVYVLANALVYARTKEDDYRDAVLEGLEEAIGSEGQPQDTGILAVARNLPPYVIAADLINLPAADPDLAESFRRWLLHLRSTVFSGDGGSHTLMSCHETRPNNFGTHCGAARVAVAHYLDDEVDLARAAMVFRGWLGDRSAYSGFEYGRLTWQGDPDRPVGINPPDTSKEGQDIGGALPEEMRRSGQFEWPPRQTGYAWEALQGAVVQAELLDRAGYPAWTWQENAIRRAVQFLHDLDWPAEGDDEWQPWLINHAYGTDFPAHSPAKPGKNMGWTDWSHAGSGRSSQQANGENQ